MRIQLESESRLCNFVTSCFRNTHYKLLRSHPWKLSYSRPVSRLNYYLGSFASYMLTVNPSSYLESSHQLKWRLKHGCIWFIHCWHRKQEQCSLTTSCWQLVASTKCACCHPLGKGCPCPILPVLYLKLQCCWTAAIEITAKSTHVLTGDILTKINKISHR